MLPENGDLRRGTIDPLGLTILGFLITSLVVGTIALVQHSGFDIRERAKDAYASPSTTITLLADDEPCSKPEQCRSGYCGKDLGDNTFVCLPKNSRTCTPNGERKTKDLPCCASTTYTSYPAPGIAITICGSGPVVTPSPLLVNGNLCNGPKDCASGYCSPTVPRVCQGNPNCECTYNNQPASVGQSLVGGSDDCYACQYNNDGTCSYGGYQDCTLVETGRIYNCESVCPTKNCICAENCNKTSVSKGATCGGEKVCLADGLAVGPGQCCTSKTSYTQSNGITKCGNAPLIVPSASPSPSVCQCASGDATKSVGQTVVGSNFTCYQCVATANGSCDYVTVNSTLCKQDIRLTSCTQTCLQDICICPANCHEQASVKNGNCGGNITACERLNSSESCQTNTACIFDSGGCHSKLATDVNQSYQSILDSDASLIRCATAVQQASYDRYSSFESECESISDIVDLNSHQVQLCLDKLADAESVFSFNDVGCKDVLNRVISRVVAPVSSIPACAQIDLKPQCATINYCSWNNNQNDCQPQIIDPSVSGNCSCREGVNAVLAGTSGMVDGHCNNCVVERGVCVWSAQCKIADVSTAQTPDLNYQHVLDAARDLQNQYPVVIGINEPIGMEVVEQLGYTLNLLQNTNLLISSATGDTFRINIYSIQGDGVDGYTRALLRDSIINVAYYDTDIFDFSSQKNDFSYTLIHEATHQQTIVLVPEHYCGHILCTALGAYYAAQSLDNSETNFLLLLNPSTSSEYSVRHDEFAEEAFANAGADYILHPEEFAQENPCTYVMFSDDGGPFKGVETETVNTQTGEVQVSQASRRTHAIEQCDARQHQL